MSFSRTCTSAARGTHDRACFVQHDCMIALVPSSAIQGGENRGKRTFLKRDTLLLSTSRKFRLLFYAALQFRARAMCRYPPSDVGLRIGFSPFRKREGCPVFLLLLTRVPPFLCRFNCDDRQLHVSDRVPGPFTKCVPDVSRAVYGRACLILACFHGLLSALRNRGTSNACSNVTNSDCSLCLAVLNVWPVITGSAPSRSF